MPNRPEPIPAPRTTDVDAQRVNVSAAADSAGKATESAAEQLQRDSDDLTTLLEKGPHGCPNRDHIRQNG